MSKEELTIARFGGPTWKQIIDAILTRPTVEVWPFAGPPLGYRSKSASYDAARKGLIRTLEMGRKRPVPTPWLRQVLGLHTRRRQRRRKTIDAERRPLGRRSHFKNYTVAFSAERRAV